LGEEESLFETSGVVISKARFRVLQRDETFARLLEIADHDLLDVVHLVRGRSDLDPTDRGATVFAAHVRPVVQGRFVNRPTCPV
jgi:hypothetical protein